MTVRAILELFENLDQNYGVHELCTRRLNQDLLENLFAVIRQQHDCNVNPSSRQFEHGDTYTNNTIIKNLEIH